MPQHEVVTRLAASRENGLDPRIKHVLFFREPLRAALKKVGGLAFFHLQTARVAGVEVLQPKTLALRDSKRVGVLLDLVENLFSRHGVTSLAATAVHLQSSAARYSRPDQNDTRRGMSARARWKS
jgi:hypothetical protein